MAWGELPVEGQTLSPLTSSHHSGLVAITVLSLLSFFSSLGLFTYLTYKIVAWNLYVRNNRRAKFQHQESHQVEPQDRRTTESREARYRQDSQHAIDFTLGIDGVFNAASTPPKDLSDTDKTMQRERSPSIRPMTGAPNQFLILIYNLLLADLHQSIAFALNSAWISRNGIIVGTRECFVQGLFVATGDLSSSMFITLIAIHTYLSVVKGYRPSQRTLYIAIACAWIFVYVMSLAPIAISRNGAAVGGYYVRAGAWCWINNEYENTRLFTHYLWIFMALATTSGLYIAIWYFLRRQEKQRADNPNASPSREVHGEYNRAFLIYPLIYVTCTLPLATERVATMAGASVPLGLFCFAGALISLNGFFDCLVFGTTRHAIIFASKYDVDAVDTGVKTIAFLQTPKNRRYGNMVWVQGGENGPRTPDLKTTGGWFSFNKLAGPRDKRIERQGPRGSSQESLRGPGIQMDLVTTVVVEVESDKEHDIRYPDPAASASPSVNSTERDFSRAM